MNIYEKLLAIQAELKAPKSQYNSFGKYNYRNCEDILEALKPLLAKIKATLIINDEITNIADRFYVKAIARFVDVETGERIEATAFAREEESKKGMDSSQVTGATSSYARKYALNGLFAIDDTKDADTLNQQDTKPKAQPKPKTKATALNEETTNELNKLILDYSEKVGKPVIDISKELTEYIKTPLKQINMEQAKVLLKYLKDQISKG